MVTYVGFRLCRISGKGGGNDNFHVYRLPNGQTVFAKFPSVFNASSIGGTDLTTFWKVLKREKARTFFAKKEVNYAI